MPKDKTIFEPIGSKGFNDIFNKVVKQPAKKKILEAKQTTINSQKKSFKDELKALEKKEKDLRRLK